jgi:hypothetical protein
MILRLPAEWGHQAVIGVLVQTLYFGLAYIAMKLGVSKVRNIEKPAWQATASVFVFAQHLLGLHPHDVDDAEGAGQQHAQDPGEVPHRASPI